MNTFEQITKETAFVNKLIKNGRDDFDIGIAIELRQLTERIQDKRRVSVQAARKIVRELLGAGQKSTGLGFRERRRSTTFISTLQPF